MERLVTVYQQLVSIFTYKDMATLLLIVAATKLLYFVFIRPFRSPLRKLPGRPYIPLIGNMFERRKGETVPTGVRWLRMHKSLTIRYYFFGGRERIFTADPKVFRHILVTNEENYRRAEPLSAFTDQFSKALFFLSGEDHHKVRHLINPAFSRRMLQNMIPVFDMKSQMVVEQWMEEFDKADPSKEQLEFPVEKYLNRIVLDSICETVLEFNMDAVTFPHADEVKLLINFLTPNVGASFATSVIPFYKYLPLQRIRESRKGEEFIKNIIKKKVYDKKQNISGNQKYAVGNARNVLSLLTSAEDERGNPLPDDLVIENVLGLLAAGYLTTSHTLTWIMLQLAMYQDVQARARQEILDVVPRHCNEITAEILNKLQYLQCVIKETLRLFPSLSNTSRVAVSDDDINGVHVPAGTMIVMDLGTLHRMEENWESPDKFIPERFMEETKPYTHLPFLAGPYMCIGHKYALLQISTVLCNLLREFEFTLVPNITFRKKLIDLFLIKPHPDLVLHVKKIALSQ